MATRRKAPPTRRRPRPPVRHYLSLSSKEKGGQDYIPAGCTLLDCALGGGWAKDRMVNIVGDSSTGKTLLAIEACANFARTYSGGLIKFAEAENAFDPFYASAVGLPDDRVEFMPSPHEHGITLVEDVFEWLDAMSDQCKREKEPGMFILDSLDATSARKEMERDINDDSYGTERARKLGEAVRKINGKAVKSGITIIIISQTRQNIGVTFGPTKKRSGGASLDFYASQIAWLSDLGQMKKNIRGVERPVGKHVRVRVRKNKAGLAHRDCDIPIIFGYGIDDMMANAEFLDTTIGFGDDRIATLGLKKGGYKNTLLKLRNEGGQGMRAVRALLSETVEEVWLNLEKEFLPQRGKYE